MESGGSLLRLKELLLVLMLMQINPVHTFHPISVTSILILFLHICLGFPSGIFPSGFLTKILC
jgi:hypothetical protein